MMGLVLTMILLWLAYPLLIHVPRGVVFIVVAVYKPIDMFM